VEEPSLIEVSLYLNKLIRDHSSDGPWKSPFETGISTDAYMIILLRTLKIHDKKFLAARIMNKQLGNFL
jgi:sporulenol synthase